MTKHKFGSRTVSALIALVMVLAMFPVTTLAAVNTVAIDEAATTYDFASEEVTLNASISEYGADVTIIAVRTNEAIESLAGFQVDSLKDIIAYIDQVPSGADGKVTKTFKLRELAGTKLTIAVGGKDVSTPDLYTLSLAKSPATITVAESYVAGTKIGLGFADANGWKDATGKVVKVNGETVESGIIVEDNTLYVGDDNSSVFGLEETETEKTHTLKIEVPGFDPVEKTVKVIAPTKATASQLPAGGTALKVDYDALDPANGAATVTLPTVTTEYAPVAWQVNGVAASVSDGKITLTRPESTATDDTITHTVKAVIEKSGYIKQEIEYSATVKKLGLAGPNILASEITLTGTNVYGKTGAKIITIDTAETINTASEKIVIGGTTELYYSPVRDKFVGIVTGYADAAAALEALTVAAGASTKLYYGNVDTPATELTACDIFDVMGALQLKNNVNPSATDAQWLSADVADGNGVIDIFDVMQVLAKKNDGATVFYIDAN